MRVAVYRPIRVVVEHDRWRIEIDHDEQRKRSIVSLFGDEMPIIIEDAKPSVLEGLNLVASRALASWNQEEGRG